MATYYKRKQGGNGSFYKIKIRNLSYYAIVLRGGLSGKQIFIQLAKKIIPANRIIFQNENGKYS